MRFRKNKDKPGINWFVRRGNKVRGPLSSGAIRRLVSEKKIVPTDEVSLDKEIWRRVGQVAEVLPPGMRGKDDQETVDDYSGIAESQPLPFEEKTPFPTIPLLISLLVVGSVVGAFLAFDKGGNSDKPDCAAAPAPGVNWNNCPLGNLQAQQLDLTGLQASNSDLQNAKLSGAKLINANLQYANLAGIDLSYSDLSGTSLKGATLRNADLSNADLSNADLSYANLSGANLGNAKLDNAIWSGGKRCAAGSVGSCITTQQP